MTIICFPPAVRDTILQLQPVPLCAQAPGCLTGSFYLPESRLAGLVLLPSQYLQVRIRRLTGSHNWSLSNWVPRYWCCCLLHWSGLSGQCPQQPPGGFSKARQHSGVFVLVSVHCNYRPLSVYFIPFVLFPLFFCFYLLICVLVRTSGHMIVM